MFNAMFSNESCLRIYTQHIHTHCCGSCGWYIYITTSFVWFIVWYGLNTWRVCSTQHTFYCDWWSTIAIVAQLQCRRLIDCLLVVCVHNVCVTAVDKKRVVEGSECGMHAVASRWSCSRRTTTSMMSIRRFRTPDGGCLTTRNRWCAFAVVPKYERCNRRRRRLAWTGRRDSRRHNSRFSYDQWVWPMALRDVCAICTPRSMGWMHELIHVSWWDILRLTTFECFHIYTVFTQTIKKRLKITTSIEIS